MNNYVMNERLRFSWGHIIAFVALIIVSYVSFVGFTYLSDGNFIFGACGMVVTDLMFLFVFIGAQQLKASSFKMKKKIVWERTLILVSPLIFCAGMVAMSHFWTVRSLNDEVVEQFNSALDNGQKIFTDYEAYANGRIENYSRNLDKIIAARQSNPQMYARAGFQQSLESVQKDNMVEVLKLQLLSSNYDSLKTLADEWIDKAHNGASTLNVFLLGNTRDIHDALINWEDVLKGYTTKRLSNEQLLGPVEPFESNAGRASARELEGLGTTFTQQKIPTASAIIFGVIIYLMMIFPYFIQERHSKSVYSLMGGKGKKKKGQQHPETFEDMGDDDDGPKTTYKQDEDFPTF